MLNVSLVDGHIDEVKKRPYDISPEPLWCEDCKHFCNADMGGEGMCDIDNHDTWYGCPICEKAELKCGEVKKQTNYDRIRNMGVEEMAEKIRDFLFAHLNKFNVGIGNPPQTLTEQEKTETAKLWLEWLESEVDTE